MAPLSCSMIIGIEVENRLNPQRHRPKGVILDENFHIEILLSHLGSSVSLKIPVNGLDSCQVCFSVTRGAISDSSENIFTSSIHGPTLFKTKHMKFLFGIMLVHPSCFLFMHIVQRVGDY